MKKLSLEARYWLESLTTPAPCSEQPISIFCLCLDGACHNKKELKELLEQLDKEGEDD